MPILLGLKEQSHEIFAIVFLRFKLTCAQDSWARTFFCLEVQDFEDVSRRFLMLSKIGLTPRCQ